MSLDELVHEFELDETVVHAIGTSSFAGCVCVPFPFRIPRGQLWGCFQLYGAFFFLLFVG